MESATALLFSNLWCSFVESGKWLRGNKEPESWGTSGEDSRWLLTQKQLKSKHGQGFINSAVSFVLETEPSKNNFLGTFLSFALQLIIKKSPGRRQGRETIQSALAGSSAQLDSTSPSLLSITSIEGPAGSLWPREREEKMHTGTSSDTRGDAAQLCGFPRCRSYHKTSLPAVDLAAQGMRNMWWQTSQHFKFSVAAEGSVQVIWAVLHSGACSCCCDVRPLMGSPC